MSEIAAQIGFRSAEAGLATQTHFLVRAFEKRGTLARRGTANASARGGASLASESQPTVSGARQSWTNGSLDCRAARLWHSDRVAASLGETLRQRAGEGVGHAGVGRADSRRRRAVGMDEVSLGPHDDARAGMPSVWGGMSTAGLWRTLTNVSKADAVSKNARGLAPTG
jgi:hypothetical protein